MENKALELYYLLKCCKEGNCNKCDRFDFKSANTYPCRKKLLQECFDWFNKYLD